MGQTGTRQQDSRLPRAGGPTFDLPAGAAVLAGTGASLLGVLCCLSCQQPGQEDRKVDRHERLPVRAAVRVVFRREPEETAPDLAELPLDVDQRK